MLLHHEKSNELAKHSFFAEWGLIVGSLLLLGVISGILIYQFNSRTNPQPATELAKLTAAAKSRIMATFVKMPLSFETNQGQVDSQVKYLSRGQGYTLFFTPSELVFAFSTPISNEVMRAGFVGANPNAVITASDKLKAKTNYFIGHDPKQWHTNIENFGRVNYQNIYPGIDAAFYGNQGQLEYDIRVAPHASPAAFKLNFQGVKSLTINQQGDLVLTAASGKTISMHKPMVYQEIQGIKHNIEGNFVLLAKQQVGFKIGTYDQTKPLVIDPILYYSTYLGGHGTPINDTVGKGIALDNAGSVYVTGYTASGFFPTTANAFQTSSAISPGTNSAFVTKFNSTYGNAVLEYSSYLGGDDSHTTQGNSIVVDSSGNAYVTGQTQSLRFPVLHDYQSTLNGQEAAFVTVFNSTGSGVIYSTYLGSNVTGNTTDTTFGLSIDIDASGNAYVTGYTTSSNFPTAPTPGAYLPAKTWTSFYDAFVTKFIYTGVGNVSLGYSTYLGNTSSGTGTVGFGIAVDSSGSAYVTGGTDSNSFPTVNNFSGGGTKSGSNADAYVTKFNSAGVALLYSSYLGGSSGNSVGTGIAVNKTAANSNAYVTGFTNSSSFPLLHSYNSTLQGSGSDAFVTAVDSSGTNLIYSTYIGGSGGNSSDLQNGTQAQAVAVDSAGNVYVVGETDSTNFPCTTDGFQTSKQSSTDSIEAFITKFNNYSGSGNVNLGYSTYLGGEDTPGNIASDIANGVAVDLNNFYVVGVASNTIFPVTTNAYAMSADFTSNAFVAWFAPLPTVNWVKQTITNSTGSQVDVFDLMTTTNSSCTGACLWSATRYEENSSKATTRLSRNAVTPSTWVACTPEGGGAPLTYGTRFGINKVVDAANHAPVYVVTDLDVQQIEYSILPTGCNAVQLSNTGSTDATSFLQTDANHSYYIAYNSSGSDTLMLGSLQPDQTWRWFPVNPDPSQTNLRINYIDGDDAAKRAFIATSNGTYACNIYPLCVDWTNKLAGNFSRVFYKRIPGDQSTTPVAPDKYLLIASTNNGIYASMDNGTNWSSQVSVPSGNIISGIAADVNNVYISSYAAAVAPKRADVATIYSANNLKLSDCHHKLGEMLNAIGTGGVSVAKIYSRGAANVTLQMLTNLSGETNGYFDFGNSAIGYSKAVLGVSLLTNSTTGVASAIYVPSLGPTCNSGGYSVATVASVLKTKQGSKH